MKHEQTVQVELQEYICMVKRIDGVVAQKLLEQELIRCKDCIKKELCSIFRDTRQELGFCAWAGRKEE